MSSDFKNIEWHCASPGCTQRIAQRFHVPTDGDPSKAAPPPPWTLESNKGARLFFCPECSKERRAAERRAALPASITYADLTDEEAVELWDAEHRCRVCKRADICKFAPHDPSYSLLVVVSRCRAFEYDIDRDED